MAYDLLKLAHVIGAIAWVGGAATLTLLNRRLVRSSAAPATQAALAAAASGMGRVFLGPAAMVTLIAGIATAAVGGLDMGDLWMAWGFAGLVVSVLLGATLMRRTQGALAVALAGHTTTPGTVDALRDRLAVLNVVNLLVLISVVAAMVLKPTL